MDNDRDFDADIMQKKGSFDAAMRAVFDRAKQFLHTSDTDLILLEALVIQKR